MDSDREEIVLLQVSVHDVCVCVHDVCVCMMCVCA